ncbi:GlxA family transcriptional regulator [Marinovum sp.]|uniref:GlxA family transcriptional regulator n=1 Tax=Marinovum sp. TaxID=2024839 RepID=UPI002B272764|nr:helix-turn-helix domain-containing protein [Marinovum sp.]
MNAISFPAPAPVATRHGAMPPIAVLVLPGFSLLSLAAILDPLAYVQDSEQALSCRTFGLSRRRVCARAGQEFFCDGDSPGLLDAVKAGRAPKLLILCGGPEVAQHHALAALPLIRRAARTGTRLVGVGGANTLLAEAGLLDGGSGAIHWKSARAFGECHPKISLTSGLFTNSGRSGTCAGELAALDMILDLIRREASPSAAQSVCDHFLVGHPRTADCPQPGARGEKLRHLPEVLQVVIGRMIDNMEDPLTSVELLEDIPMSARQLERLFRRHLGTSPISHYLGIRLDAAHQLVTQTDLDLHEVALATGFGSRAYLSRKLKQRYGATPCELRRRLAETAPQPVPAASGFGRTGDTSL